MKLVPTAVVIPGMRRMPWEEAALTYLRTTINRIHLVQREFWDNARGLISRLTYRINKTRICR